MGPLACVPFDFFTLEHSSPFGAFQGILDGTEYTRSRKSVQGPYPFTWTARVVSKGEKRDA